MFKKSVGGWMCYTAAVEMTAVWLQHTTRSNHCFLQACEEALSPKIVIDTSDTVSRNRARTFKTRQVNELHVANGKTSQKWTLGCQSDPPHHLKRRQYMSGRRQHKTH
jgi:hypothetical protein